jgi:hypothetical protein
MLIHSWIWQTLSRQLRCGGAKPDHPDNLAIASRSVPTVRLPFTTRPFRCHRRVRSGHFIGATPSSSLVPDLKTSFSRSNPVPRGQATVIRPFIRGNPKDTNNERSRVTSFLPTSNPSPISGRLGLQRVHRERARTWVKPTPGSLQINLLFTILQNRHQAYRQVQTYFSSKTRMFSTRINTKTLVELSGIEPLTPCLQSRCSPS